MTTLGILITAIGVLVALGSALCIFARMSREVVRLRAERDEEYRINARLRNQIVSLGIDTMELEPVPVETIGDYRGLVASTRLTATSVAITPSVIAVERDAHHVIAEKLREDKRVANVLRVASEAHLARLKSDSNSVAHGALVFSVAHGALVFCAREKTFWIWNTRNNQFHRLIEKGAIAWRS